MNGIRKILGNVLLLIISMAFGVMILEGSIRFYQDVLKKPIYSVFYLTPDTDLGWKGVPNLSFTWAGHRVNCVEYSVPIHLNKLGFHDSMRETKKPANTVRIAVLGDSMVEALQVPLESTATQLLENKLNSVKLFGDKECQVLNFGVSAYGVGQYLLMYQKYASKFSPSYVFIFVAPFHMMRTVENIVNSPLTGASLDVRPRFEVKDGKLVSHKGSKYKELSFTHEKIIEYYLSGKRSRVKRLNYKRTLPLKWRIPKAFFGDQKLLELLIKNKILETNSYIPQYVYFPVIKKDELRKRLKEINLSEKNTDDVISIWQQSLDKVPFWKDPINWIKEKSYLYVELSSMPTYYENIKHLYWRISNNIRRKSALKQGRKIPKKDAGKISKVINRTFQIGDKTENLTSVINLNYEIIKELNKAVTKNGGKLIFVDVSQHFKGRRIYPLSAFIEGNKKLCEDNGIGYIDLGKALREFSIKGESVHWVCDGHFNKAGNKVFFEEMYKWINKHK